MSNRNFDCRISTQRRADRVIAQNIYSYQQSGLSPISNPLTSSASPQRVGQYSAGIQTTFYKGLTGGSYMGSVGGNANYILTTEELAAVTETISSIPAGDIPVPTSNTPAALAPSPPTDLSVEADYESAIIRFTEGFNGNSPIINYQYTIDEGVTFQLFDPPQITSPVTITGLTNGLYNYSITLKAVNSAGISEISEYVSVMPITAPSPPTDLSGASGNGQVAVSFTEGFDGNSPIMNYLYSINNGSTFTAVDPSDNLSPVTITGLTNGTTYQIKLKAVNGFGTSLDSSAISVIPSTIPNAPTGLSTTPGNGQVTISFTAGSNGGSPITNYQYSTNNGGIFTPFSSAVTSSPVTITGLTNGTTYPIRLKAVNANGVSAESSAVSATPIIPSTVPSPPTGLSATVGDGQVTISFTAGSDGGSAITNYQYSTNNGNTFTAFSSAVTSSTVTITGLVNGTTYQIKLKAVNAIGIGAASAAVSVTPTGVPSPPTNLTSVGGDGRAYILFTAGNNGGSPITNYSYSINGDDYVILDSAEISSPLEIPGLSNDTQYDITLKAINSFGSSIASASVSVTPQVNTLNTSGLLVELDADNPSSYPGSGTVWTNLRSNGSYSATMPNGSSYTTGPDVLTFNGTNQYANIISSSGIQPVVGGALTAQVWAKVNSGVQFGDGLISKQFSSTGGYDGYSLSLRTDGSMFLKMNGSNVDGTYSSAQNVYTVGQWALYTIVVRFGGGSANPSYAYVSTHRVITGNNNNETGIPNPNAPLQIPRGIQDSTFNYAPASIGKFYYYNTALSQEDIIRNFDAKRSHYGV